jgi:hypothetical protein
MYSSLTIVASKDSQINNYFEAPGGYGQTDSDEPNAGSVHQGFHANTQPRRRRISLPDAVSWSSSLDAHSQHKSTSCHWRG